jgi:hypothetical protein
MKISLRCHISGFLLVLISAAAFSQDSTHPAPATDPVDSAHPAIPPLSRDTIVHAYRNDSALPALPPISQDKNFSSHIKDTIPAPAKDSTGLTAGVHAKDSTLSSIKDSTHKAARIISGGVSVQDFSSGRRNGNGRQSPAIGHFYGRIIDTKTNKGMDGTSVQLVMAIFDSVTHNRRDSVIRGAITPSNGDFSFENLPIFGNYRLKLTAIGYKSVDQRVAFNFKDAQSADPEQRLGAVDKDLGNIKMENDPTSLSK